jgi:hypothetical protein
MRPEKTYVKVARPSGPDGEGERWAYCEVSPTLNVFDNLGDVRAVVLAIETLHRGRNTMAKAKQRSYGFNPQSSLMYPCSKEVSEVLTVCHGARVVTYGIKARASEKSRMPYSKDIAQALSAGCHDASVVIGSAK